MQENQLWSLRNKQTMPNAPKQIRPCVKTGLLESSTNDPDFTARVKRRCETENKISEDLSVFSFSFLGIVCYYSNWAPWHLRSVYRELVHTTEWQGTSQEEKFDHSWLLLPYNVGQRIPTSREHFKQLYQPLLRKKPVLTKYSGRLRPMYIPDHRKQKAYELNIYPTLKVPSLLPGRGSFSGKTLICSREILPNKSLYTVEQKETFIWYKIPRGQMLAFFSLRDKSIIHLWGNFIIYKMVDNGAYRTAKRKN